MGIKNWGKRSTKRQERKGSKEACFSIWRRVRRPRYFRKLYPFLCLFHPVFCPSIRPTLTNDSS